MVNGSRFVASFLILQAHRLFAECLAIPRKIIIFIFLFNDPLNTFSLTVMLMSKVVRLFGFLKNDLSMHSIHFY